MAHECAASKPAARWCTLWRVSNNRPLAALAGTGRKTISRTISRKPIQASRPRCKVHGAAVLVAQVAMSLHFSALTKGDTKTP